MRRVHLGSPYPYTSSCSSYVRARAHTSTNTEIDNICLLTPGLGEVTQGSSDQISEKPRSCTINKNKLRLITTNKSKISDPSYILRSENTDEPSESVNSHRAGCLCLKSTSPGLTYRSCATLSPHSAPRSQFP